jgi:hypothetical protein
VNDQFICVFYDQIHMHSHTSGHSTHNHSIKLYTIWPRYHASHAQTRNWFAVVDISSEVYGATVWPTANRSPTEHTHRPSRDGTDDLCTHAQSWPTWSSHLSCALRSGSRSIEKYRVDQISDRIVLSIDNHLDTVVTRECNHTERVWVLLQHNNHLVMTPTHTHLQVRQVIYTCCMNVRRYDRSSHVHFFLLHMCTH